MKKEYLITKKGLEKARKRLKELEEKLKNVLSQKGEAGEIGGNVWHDNFSFEQLVREEQMLIAQINELKEVIRNAKIIKESIGSKTVNVGSRVTLLFEGKRKVEYKIVGLMESDPQKNNISYESPLGSAIFGAKKGDKREVKIGKEKKIVEILEIK